MAWHLDWGDKAAWLEEVADGTVVPALQSRVDPDEHLAFEWTAFWQLSTDRAIGFGVGPIPWSSIDAYARRFGMDDPEEFETFALLMRVMDAVYLDHSSEKTKE